MQVLTQWVWGSGGGTKVLHSHQAFSGCPASWLSDHTWSHKGLWGLIQKEEADL